MRVLFLFLAFTWSGLVAALGVGLLLRYPGTHLSAQAVSCDLESFPKSDLRVKLVELQEEVHRLREGMPALLAQASWRSEQNDRPPSAQIISGQGDSPVLESISDGVAVIRDGGVTRSVRIGDLLRNERIVEIDTEGGLVRTSRHSYALGD